MFTFAIVKRIGEGHYLSDDAFILERARKERALMPHRLKADKNRSRYSNIARYARLRAS